MALHLDLTASVEGFGMGGGEVHAGVDGSFVI
jgi:hypothetical protein